MRRRKRDVSRAARDPHGYSLRQFSQCRIAQEQTDALSGRPSCGPPATPAGQDVLIANVEQDLKPEERKALLGALHMPVAGITFPDGRGSVDAERAAA